MTDSYTVELSVADIDAALAKLADRASDLTPAMGEISRYLASQIEERFRTETAPDGTPWKPSQRVAGYTDALGHRHPGDGGQTLTLHSYLRRSIREDFGVDYAAAGPQASGPAAIYARLMQEGGKITPRTAGALKTPFGPRASVTIPARPYLGFDEGQDGPEILHILGDFLAQGLGAAA